MRKCVYIFTLYSLLLFSCENDKTRLRDLLGKTDRVILEKFFVGDTLKCEVTDKSEIEIFTKTIGGERQDVHTDNALGQIVYFSGNNIVFKVSITANGIQYVFDNYIYKEKITYRAGMYFSEASYK